MFRVQVSGLEWYLNKFAASPNSIAIAMTDAARKIEPLIVDVIKETFVEAAAAAGPGFPPVYLDALLGVVDTAPIMSTGGGMMHFNVLWSFESLGDYDDLMEGAHFRARLADGGYSDIPYGGQELANPKLKRYLAWLRLEDAFREDTYETRASYWASQNKAPQWLLLNNGQTLYSPTIPPYPVVERVIQKLSVLIKPVVEAELDKQLAYLWRPQYVPAANTEILRIDGRMVGVRSTRTTGAFKSRPGYEWIRINNKMAGSRKINPYYDPGF